MVNKISVMLLALLIGTFGLIAQAQTTTPDGQVRSLSSGQKYKLEGTVVSKDDNGTFILRDTTGNDTRVVIGPEASIKTKGGFFGGGDKIASNQIVRGLYMTVEGRGDGSGNLAATKVRFDKDDFRTAQSIETRVAPAEERLTLAEQNQSQKYRPSWRFAVVRSLHAQFPTCDP